MILFFKIFFTEFIAEMGDKTQLMLIALTSKHKLKDIILGTAAALAFLYFAASTIAGDEDDEEEEGGKSKIKFAPLAVFCTFFLAELGDKTQLTAITFGANEGMEVAFVMDRMFAGTFCSGHSWNVSRLSFKEQNSGWTA